MRCHTSPFFKLLRHNAKSASILIFFTLMLSLLLSTSLLRQDFNLDGCYHVYLDVGTNVGIQIRKLYEPEKYPNASIHKFFDEHFKRNNVSSSRHICAIGFEPNPRHVSILQSKPKNNLKVSLEFILSHIESFILQTWNQLIKNVDGMFRS